MKSIDEVFKMCESRYTLVTLVARRAREIAEELEKRSKDMPDDAARRNDKRLTEKSVNIVLDNLKSGKSTIVKPGAPTTLYRSEDFEVGIMSEQDDDGNL